MKNKKFVKTSTILSSLMGLAVASSSLSSTIISSKQNDTAKSDINNEAKASSYENTTPTNELWADASVFFEGNSTVKGRLGYKLGTIGFSHTITITDCSSDFTITNGVLKYWVTISAHSTTREYLLIGIDEYAFSRCNGLKGKLTLSSHITTIGRYAFEECSQLTSINMSGSGISLESIGYGAFYNCANLSSIDFDNGDGDFKTIGDKSFFGCASLTSITIPSSVTSIGDFAFAGCHITSVNFTGNEYYSLASNNGDKGHILVSGSGKNTWDGKAKPVGCLAYGDISYEGLSNTAIEDSLFAYSSIKSITLSSYITSINESAFLNSPILFSVYFDSATSLQTIGGSAFAGCTSLNLIDFTKTPNLQTIGTSAFAGCTNLYTLDFTSATSLSAIGQSAFEGCINLSFIHFCEEGNLSSIYPYAFKNTNFYKFSIPSSVTKLGQEILAGCKYLTDIYLNWNAEQLESIVPLGNINANWLANIASGTASPTMFHIPAGSISTYNKYNTQLGLFNTALDDGEKNLSIPVDQFSSCYNSQGSALIGIDGQNAIIKSGYNVSATDISFNDQITYNGNKYSLIGIDGYSFHNDSNIVGSLSISESISSIGEGAFDGCTELTSVNLTNATNLTTISQSIFEGCGNLSAITFPSGSALTTISASAFKDTDLTSISIPGSVTALGENIFSGCENLTDVYLNWDENQVKEIVESGNINQEWLAHAGSGNLVVHVPIGTMSAYNKYSFQLGLFGYTLVDDFGLFTVSASGFCEGDIDPSGSAVIQIHEGNAYIVSGHNLSGSNISLNKGILIGNGIYPLVGINDEAFLGNKNISGSLTLPSTITSIGHRAFQGCVNITQIDLPWTQENFDNIGFDAFTNCLNLKSIKLPYDVLFDFPANNDFGIDVSQINVYSDEVPAGFVFSSYENSYPEGECTINITGEDEYGVLDAKSIRGSNLGLQTGCTKIADEAFKDNTSITGSITIPNTVSNIGANALDGCVGIDQINLTWDTEDQIKIVAENIDPTWLGSIASNNLTINVPYNTKSLYEKYANSLNIDEVTIIGEGSGNGLALGLGLGLGLGVPAVAGITTGTILGVKKHKNKK